MDDKVKIGLENLKNAESDLEERLSEIKERTSEFVKEYPLTSIAIAAGVGFLIARLFSGRRQ